MVVQVVLKLCFLSSLELSSGVGVVEGRPRVQTRPCVATQQHLRVNYVNETFFDNGGGVGCGEWVFTMV